MSFFGQLLAGAAAGGAGGYIKDREDDERASAQKALKQEQYAQQLALQRERQQDRIDMFQMGQAGKTGSSRSSSGSSGGDDPLRDLLFSAKTPEEQAQALGYIKSLAGGDAAMLVSENVFGRLPTKERQYETIDALGDGISGGPASVAERASYDRDQGQKELRRFYALIANKGQTKSNAEGEAQYFSNDARTTAVSQELKRGKSLVDAADIGARVADPEAYDRNQANRERIDASIQNARTRTQGATANTETREDAATVRALEARKQQYLKQIGDPMVADDLKTVLQMEIDDINRRLKAGTQPTATTAAKPSSNWTATGNTPRTAGKVPTLDELRAKYSNR